MAEPPCALTDLIYQKRYTEFIHALEQHGLLKSKQALLDRLVESIHAELSAKRHPPGPTVERLVILRLIDSGIIDSKIHTLLA